jgi:hypothetical protein
MRVNTRCLDMNNYGKKQKQKRLELRNFKCLQIPKLHELQRLKGRCILDSQIWILFSVCVWKLWLQRRLHNERQMKRGHQVHCTILQTVCTVEKQWWKQVKYVLNNT